MFSCRLAKGSRYSWAQPAITSCSLMSTWLRRSLYNLGSREKDSNTHWFINLNRGFYCIFTVIVTTVKRNAIKLDRLQMKNRNWKHTVLQRQTEKRHACISQEQCAANHFYHNKSQRHYENRRSLPKNWQLHTVQLLGQTWLVEDVQYIYHPRLPRF